MVHQSAPRELLRLPVYIRPERLRGTFFVCSSFRGTTPAKAQLQPFTRRQIHSSSQLFFKERYFPAPDAPSIRTTEATWPHPIYSEEQMRAVNIAHRRAKTWSDWIALSTIRLLRRSLDFITGYKHDNAVALNQKDPGAAAKTYKMTARKYLIRNIFLESVAGVPGMVSGMLRHLHSMRRMRRDNGWSVDITKSGLLTVVWHIDAFAHRIETLLEESYNERMHLLTFLKLAEPGWFMKIAVIGAQGIFFNAFFLAYLISPKICHRFVGYLEEEAVITYSREIAELEAGRLPQWENLDAPDIAVQYWNMPEGHRKMRDLLLYIRADEAKHREVNHTLANLNQVNDPNPYASKYKDSSKSHPSKSIEVLKPSGWERHEVL